MLELRIMSTGVDEPDHLSSPDFAKVVIRV